MQSTVTTFRFFWTDVGTKSFIFSLYRLAAIDANLEQELRLTRSSTVDYAQTLFVILRPRSNKTTIYGSILILSPDTICRLYFLFRCESVFL